MGLKNLVLNLLFLRSKPFRVAGTTLYYLLRLKLGCPNYNYLNQWNGKYIAQPRYFNDKADISLLRLIRAFLWTSDLNSVFKSSDAERKLYSKFEYDFMCKRYFPTKNTAFENINMNLAWANSFWNPNLGKLSTEDKLLKYKHSDLLFADFVVNSQGIYKAKRIPKALEHPLRHNEISNLFAVHLQKYREELGPEYEQCDHVFNKMVQDGKLFIVEYPELMRLEQKRPSTVRYTNEVTLKDGKHEGRIQIPRAIFAEIDGYLPGRKNDFVCLGSVFNERTEVYHPFGGCMKTRSKWELAKHHFGNAAQNDYIIRVHLGFMHYGSAIYTTAFYNLAKKFPEMQKIKDEFIRPYSAGLLQINNLANITLVDRTDPTAEKGMYLRASQAIDLMSEENRKLNMLDFNPEGLGKDSYESDCVKLSKLYYNKIEAYVDYLFDKYPDWSNRPAEVGAFLYKELGSGRFCGITKDICNDNSPKTLKKLMSSLMYLWIVHHGETFSMISVNNIYYLAPTLVRKSLADADRAVQDPNNFDLHGNFRDSVKQQWFAPLPVFNNAMGITKQVTFRADQDNLVSSWSQVGLQDPRISKWLSCNSDRINVWRNEAGRGPREDNSVGGLRDSLINNPRTIYSDYWNDMAVLNTDMQRKRLDKGLFYMHWMLPTELQNSLNI